LERLLTPLPARGSGQSSWMVLSFWPLCGNFLVLQFSTWDERAPRFLPTPKCCDLNKTWVLFIY
jgi:hypothetical protein